LITICIDPILWSVQVLQPHWCKTLPKDKPVVFVTLGSSGDSSLLPMILETLSKMSVTMICVTVNKTYPNVFSNDFLSTEKAVKKSDIVICNEGSPMVYQSLVENKEIIGIPSNLDQYLMMSLLEKSKAG